MTIEFSLRRRATHARCLAILWLSLATTILVGTYISLPLVAGKTLNSVNKIELQFLRTNNNPTLEVLDARSSIHAQLYTVGTMFLGMFAISFACFLLARGALAEMELAARFCGFADALCIAGDDFDQLEKLTNLLIPSAKYLPGPEIASTKALQSVADILKILRPS
jgi:hypothetical protein